MSYRWRGLPYPNEESLPAEARLALGLSAESDEPAPTGPPKEILTPDGAKKKPTRAKATEPEAPEEEPAK